MKIVVGRGNVVVENPSAAVRDALRYFCRNGSTGEYEDLYLMSNGGEVLVTMPGFVGRILAACHNPRVVEERVPMPDPDMGTAFEGVPEAWHGLIAKAIKAEGGVVSVPDVLGRVQVAAAIMRAYHREDMLDRGTPLNVVVAASAYEAQALVTELRRAMPDRDVGKVCSGAYSDSEDVLVTTIGGMKDIQACAIGVLIGFDLSADLVKCAESLTAVRNAARWGVSSSPFGEFKVGMLLEGLFGPLCASMSLPEAVAAGAAPKVTVCWLPAPRPACSLGSGSERMMEAVAMQRNDQFLGLVADIVRQTPGDAGCLVCSDLQALLKELKARLPEATEISMAIPAQERRNRLKSLGDGVIRKALVSTECFPSELEHDVMVVASCKGVEAICGIPWRRTSQGGKAYIVDFLHSWDVHNGHPGHLARNDEVRKRRYRSLGFGQMTLGSVRELPFIG